MAGPQDLGLVEGGVDLTVPGAMVAPETLAIAEQYKAAIISGAITVPATDDELAAYVPTAPDALPAASPEALRKRPRGIGHLHITDECGGGGQLPAPAVYP